MTVSCFAGKSGHGYVLRHLTDEDISKMKQAIDQAAGEDMEYLCLQFHLLDSALRTDQNDDLVRFLGGHAALELLDWNSDTLYLKARGRQLLTIRLFDAPMRGFNMHAYQKTTPSDSGSESTDDAKENAGDNVDEELANQVKRASVSERKPKTNKIKRKARFWDEGLPGNYPSSSENSFDLDNDELEGLVERKKSMKSKVAKKPAAKIQAKKTAKQAVNRKIFADSDDEDSDFEMTQKEVHGLDSFAEFF